eukprot:PhM_4_TR6904/c0_g1_i1/m.84546/K00344/qor, CRYZ; NADPH2:quinone reductase
MAQNLLPVGRRVDVKEFGNDQMDVIRRCLVPAVQQPPTEADLVDGDIVVNVRATEIVWTDTVMSTGQYQHKPARPYTPGMTYAGTVVMTTPKAQSAGLTVGTRVAVAGPQTGPRSLDKRYQRYGGCATYAIAPMAAVRRVPSTWSFEAASCFAYGYDTAYHCLCACGEVKAGEVVLVHGATGGVGIPGVRMAKCLGARVIATTRDAGKVEFLKSVVGADVVVVIGDDVSATAWVSEVKKHTKGGKGVDVVYDGVGGDSVTVPSMRALRFGGRLLIVGWAATPNVGRTKTPNTVPTNLIMMKGLRVIGCPAMIAVSHDPLVAVRRQKQITEWIFEGRLPPPVVGATYDLDHVGDAFLSRVQSGKGPLGAAVVSLPHVVTQQRSTHSKL